MGLIRIYLDEDATHGALLIALRSRGVTVFTPLELGMTAQSDEEQLACATGRECVLYTYNVSDFRRLHTEWISTGREHAGIFWHRNNVSPLASSYASFYGFAPTRVPGA